MLDLGALADWTIRPRLLSTGGVAQVAVLGGDVKEYQILLHPERMKHYGVSLGEDKVTDVSAVVTADMIPTDGLMLRSGKKKFRRIVLK